MTISCLKNSFEYDFKLSKKKQWKHIAKYQEMSKNGLISFQHLIVVLVLSTFNWADFAWYDEWPELQVIFTCLFLVINMCLYLHHCSCTIPQEM